MINLDMIGRMRDNKLYVGGVRERFQSKADAGETGLRYRASRWTIPAAPAKDRATTRRSRRKQVPALFFFSGLHGDYHKPSDTWDKIDAPAAAKLLALVADVAQTLRDAPERPAVREIGRACAARRRYAIPAPVSGYGPYFGSIPDFGEGITGVKFADVREGSPAAKAGLKAGDIMVEFDGKPIQNLYDFTYALRGKKPGDEVQGEGDARRQAVGSHRSAFPPGITPLTNADVKYRRYRTCTWWRPWRWLPCSADSSS